MGLRPNLLTRRTAGVASTTLALLLSTAAVGVVPAASAFSAAPTEVCVEPADVHSDARVKPGSGAKHEPNELTLAETREREADMAAALRERARFRTGAGASTMAAAVTIPVVVHVIQENSTRAGGNIPDSMINSQINVLNQSFSGADRRRVHRVQLPAPEDQPGDEPVLVPDRAGLLGGAVDEDLAAYGRQEHPQHLPGRAEQRPARLGDLPDAATSTAWTASSC